MTTALLISNGAELVLQAADIAAPETLGRIKALPRSDGEFFLERQFQIEAPTRMPR